MNMDKIVGLCANVWKDEVNLFETFFALIKNLFYFRNFFLSPARPINPEPIRSIVVGSGTTGPG
jgi:hypothetical protein